MRERWNRTAKAQNMTGYNLFIREFMGRDGAVPDSERLRPRGGLGHQGAPADQAADRPQKARARVSRAPALRAPVAQRVRIGKLLIVERAIAVPGAAGHPPAHRVAFLDPGDLAHFVVQVHGPLDGRGQEDAPHVGGIPTE